MPRYLVEHFIPRAGELTAMELKAIAEQCLLVQQELEEQILRLFSAITSAITSAFASGTFFIWAVHYINIKHL